MVFYLIYRLFFVFLILSAPDDQVFGRFAAADAGVADRLADKRDAAALDAARFFLELVFARFVAAPHTADEARLVLGDIQEFFVVVRVVRFLMEVVQRTLIQTVMDGLQRVCHGRFERVERNRDLFAVVACLLYTSDAADD